VARGRRHDAGNQGPAENDLTILPLDGCRRALISRATTPPANASKMAATIARPIGFSPFAKRHGRSPGLSAQLSRLSQFVVLCKAMSTHGSARGADEQRSPDGAKRNPGFSRQIPHFACAHAGYAYWECPFIGVKRVARSEDVGGRD
jgi:hypothetical protein